MMEAKQANNRDHENCTKLLATVAGHPMYFRIIVTGAVCHHTSSTTNLMPFIS